MENKKVLLADASEPVQKIIAKAFTTENIELVIAGNYDSAVSSFNVGGFSLVLTGVSLEGKDGYALCEYVKGKVPGMPVAMLVGIEETLNTGEADRVGVDEYFVRPFKSSDFLEKTAMLMARGIVEVPEPAIPEPAIGGAPETAEVSDIPALESAEPVESDILEAPEFIDSPEALISEMSFSGNEQTETFSFDEEVAIPTADDTQDDGASQEDTATAQELDSLPDFEPVSLDDNNDDNDDDNGTALLSNEYINESSTELTSGGDGATHSEETPEEATIVSTQEPEGFLSESAQLDDIDEGPLVEDGEPEPIEADETDAQDEAGPEEVAQDDRSGQEIEEESTQEGEGGQTTSDDISSEDISFDDDAIIEEPTIVEGVRNVEIDVEEKGVAMGGIVEISKSKIEELIINNTREDVKSIAYELVPGLAKGPIKEIAPEAVEKAANEIINVLVKETVEKVAEGIVREIASEIVTARAVERVAEIAGEALQKAATERMREIAEGVAQTVARELISEIVTDTTVNAAEGLITDEIKKFKSSLSTQD